MVKDQSRFSLSRKFLIKPQLFELAVTAEFSSNPGSFESCYGYQKTISFGCPEIPTVEYFRYFGLLVWKTRDYLLLLRCVSENSGLTFHGHNDQGSLTLISGGLVLNGSMGTGRYNGVGSYRNYFRSSKAYFPTNSIWRSDGFEDPNASAFSSIKYPFLELINLTRQSVTLQAEVGRQKKYLESQSVRMTP